MSDKESGQYILQATRLFEWVSTYPLRTNMVCHVAVVLVLSGASLMSLDQLSQRIAKRI